MIKVKDGSVSMSGDIPSLFIDIILLIHSFVNACEEDIGREDAEKLLALAGKIAILDKDELEDKFDSIVSDFREEYHLDT